MFARDLSSAQLRPGNAWQGEFGPQKPPLDANALIQDVVAKIQAQGNAEVERMREAVRKAIAVLEAIVT